jgi:hypothetical protein
VRTKSSLLRLALTWLDGPQATVDVLCALGIPSDHVIAVDLAGFAALVDALGGLDIDVPAPVRDPYAGLLLEQEGPHHVDGATALALVRSRHPEHLVDGQWRPAIVDPDGRAAAAGAVLTALVDAGRLAARSPWRLQQVAWTGADAVSADAGTSFADLGGLATTDVGPVEVLPVSDPLDDTILRVATDATDDAVADAGMACTS